MNEKWEEKGKTMIKVEVGKQLAWKLSRGKDWRQRYAQLHADIYKIHVLLLRVGETEALKRILFSSFNCE